MAGVSCESCIFPLTFVTALAVIAEGTGKTPPHGVTLTAHYTGKLASNGETFDSSVTRGTPFTFPVGMGRVIKVGARMTVKVALTTAYESTVWCNLQLM